MLHPNQHQADEYSETQTNPYGFFNDTKSATACSVRVAVRVRPLVGRELFESPNICVQCYEPENQLVIGKDRAFTFDKVFDIDTRQQDIFDTCVKNLVLGCFSGYNATVLAYGQTGSGKTFTMGSGYTIGIKEQELGIIPRVIKLIFDEVEKRKSKADIVIKCAFLEIYNEELHDLLDHQSGGNSAGGHIIDRFIQKKEIQIREEKNGSISLFGLREDKVGSYEELAACLDKGSNFRSTASTLMNNCSSRSHAIFTITIEQSIIEDLYKPNSMSGIPITSPQGESTEEYMVAKFHFVDLAGSERAKRTGATGNTLKEGISINKGLLALGNVIAALTEEGKKNHVPYRDSKLTRILQDSLGGNSRTSMIACVSPAEINFEETLNSLKYASRARNIKNAPKVNRDPNSAQIAQLRQLVFDLQRELLGCKKMFVTYNIEYDSSMLSALNIAGIGEVDPRQSISGGSIRGGTGIDNQQIQRYEYELKELKVENVSKEKKILLLQAQQDQMNDQMAQNQIEFFTIKKERDIARYNLELTLSVLKKQNIFEQVFAEIQAMTNSQDNEEEMKSSKEAMVNLLSGGPGILEEYQIKVEEQRKELSDKHNQIKQLQRDFEQLLESSQADIKNLEIKEQEIERLTRSVNKLQKESIQIKNESRRGNSGVGMQQSRLQMQQINSTTQSKLQPRKSTFEIAANNRLSRVAQESATKPTTLNQPLEKELIQELDNNIQQFNEQFIENLSLSLSAMLVKKPKIDNNMKSPILDSITENDEQSETAGKFLEKHQSSDEDDEPMPEEEEISIPKDDTEQQKVLESNEELKKEDEQLRANLVQQEQLIYSIEDTLKSKEEVLQTIKEQHKLLSNNLLEAMKNEYHKKIAQFQQELQSLEQERQEQLRKADNVQQKTKLEETYKKKLKDLEEKLSLYKNKEREQQTMQKQSSSQKLKIKTLEGEIEKMKTQKVTLMKRMKEESDQHRKWKSEKVKEIIQIKSQNLRKDREIQMLKRENKKKDQMAKRKQEELSALMKKSKSDKQKQINGQKDRLKKKNIDIAYLQNWIIQNTEKMLRFKDLQSSITSEMLQKKEVEEEISVEQGQYAILSVRRDKLEFRKNQLEAAGELGFEEELYYINEEANQISFEMHAVQENIDNLEEKLDFIEGKITAIQTQVIEFSPDDIDSLKFDEVQSLEGARACLGAFFGILLDVNVYKRQLENQNIQNQATIESLANQLEELKQMNFANEISFQKQLEEMNIEYAQKEETLIKIIMENGGNDIEALLSQINNPKLNAKSFEESKGGAHQVKKFQSTIIQNAKLEIQKNNQQLYNQSKTALSKRVAELEREKKDEMKKFETLKHKLEQSNAEKELIKRQLDQIKTQKKQQDILEIKQQKVQAIVAAATEEVASSMNSMSGQKSPRLNAVALIGVNQISKMQTFKDMRNERKIKKLTGTSVQPSSSRNEPRVIADEPMENDEEDQQIQQLERQRVDTSRDSRSGRNYDSITRQNSDNQANVFARLLQPAKPKGSFVDSVGPSSSMHQASLINAADSTGEDDHNWKCAMNKEQAHSGQICALASSGNHLYSTSNKSLKIWDLQTMQQVSDIPCHTSFIRCITTWDDKKLLITASDKSIILWDMISLAQVAHLKGHKEEIRALAVGGNNKNILFSAGKGTINGGGLLIWDLRKGQTPQEERVNHLDIFSLALTPNYLFMGCRNHSVFPMNLKTYEMALPFEPPHFDAVTSLAVLSDNALISGSRDKNLRCWDSLTLKPLQSQSAILSAHTDWINTLETDHDRTMMYSGCKDGVVKVWKLKNKQLRCSAALSLSAGQAALTSSSQSINTITKIDKEFGTMFATGSADRQIRVWKYKQPNEGGPGGNNHEDDGQPDFEMVDEDQIRPENEDDMFEFETNTVAVDPNDRYMQPQHQPHPQLYQHQKSQRIDEPKLVEPRSRFTRTNSQSMLGQGNSGGLMMPTTTQGGGKFPNLTGLQGATSKLEQKRLEKKMTSQQQHQARRGYRDSDNM